MLHIAAMRAFDRAFRQSSVWHYAGEPAAVVNAEWRCIQSTAIRFGISPEILRAALCDREHYAFERRAAHRG